ncbi:MAG: hypothetical protein R2778_10335 [Saprospiraceae bacterium]
MQKILNTVWGHAWDEGMTGNTNSKRLVCRTRNHQLQHHWSSTYATGDFGFTAGSEIPGFPALTYSGPATSLWADPYDTMDFHFKGFRFTE